MSEFLNSLIDKLWLRPISLPFLYVLSVLGALGYAPDPPNPFTWKTYIIWAVFLVIAISYTFLVIKHNSLPRARECVKTCKQYKGQNSWRYSDAFLAAYEMRSPLLIYRKYATAFKYEQDLNRIVYYIEYMLDKEPERIGLHLAAGLVYHEIDEKQLSTEHLQQYLSECWNDGLFHILTEKGILINVAA